MSIKNALTDMSESIPYTLDDDLLHNQLASSLVLAISAFIQSANS